MDTTLPENINIAYGFRQEELEMAYG